jgi:hypothetical protein
LFGIKTTGTGDLDVGLAAALSLRPEVVWVVTDGDYPNPEATLQDVKRRNATVKARINAVALIEPGLDLASEFRGNLLKLTSENNGVCVGPDGQRLDENTVIEPPRNRGAAKPVGPSIFRE